MNTRRIGIVFALVALVGLTSWTGCGADQAPETLDEEALIGSWVATLEHNRQETSFVLTVERAEDGSLQGTAAMPAIGAWNMPVGAVNLEAGTRVTAGPLKLEWNPETAALETERLEGVLPVYEVSAAFHLSEPVRPPPPRAHAGPTQQPGWRTDTGAPSWSGATYAPADGGTVYVGNDAGELLALVAVDGVVRWRVSTGGAIRSRPTVAGSDVLVHADDGKLHAVAADTGRVRWTSVLTEEPGERIPPAQPGSRYDHFASAPTVVDGVAYVGASDGSLHAIDAGNGDKIWSARVGDTIAGAPAVGDGRVIVGSFDGKVSAFATGDGASIWQYDAGGAVPSSPALAGNRVLIGSRAFDFWALDAATGEPLWKFYMWFSWVDSDANVVGDTAYVGSSDALKVYAIDVTNGRARWTFDVGGWAWAQPAVTDQAVFAATVGVTDYIGERNGGLFALDRASGKLRWHYRAEPVESGMWGFAGGPAVGGGRVFAGSLDGSVYAFPQ